MQRGAGTTKLGDRGAEAGLGARLTAFAFDYLPILAYLSALVAVGSFVGRAYPDAVAVAFGRPITAQAIGFLLVTLPVALYFALAEASPRQATWGKRRRGLRVVGPLGGRLSIGRSAARTALKFVPWELAHAGVWGLTLAGAEPAPFATVLLAAAWVGVGVNGAAIAWRRRAPYDVLAGTAVVHVSPEPPA
jgi:uncharacterized RDD family membrane protein YckC